MTTKPKKPLTLCTCRHCKHWREKVEEVDAALGIMHGVHELKSSWLGDALQALRDLVGFYDRATGAVRLDHGWTASDIKRLEEIRHMVPK
jgi:hypothetical protein